MPPRARCPPYWGLRTPSSGAPQPNARGHLKPDSGVPQSKLGSSAIKLGSSAIRSSGASEARLG
eukprot:6992052-Alexandrium_andersonii.AAC.1